MGSGHDQPPDPPTLQSLTDREARNPGKFRSIPKPMGDDQIVYGDKVINNRNWSVPPWRVYPKPERGVI